MVTRESGKLLPLDSDIELNDQDHEQEIRSSSQDNLLDVYIYYGPYDVYGSVRHRTERLQGLRAMLKEQGFRPFLVPFEHRNLVEIVVHQEPIYQCQIQEFEYNISDSHIESLDSFDFRVDGKLDLACAKVMKAVRVALQ